TLLYYLTEEAQEGKQAFLEKRKPNFRRFRRYP
ncbi:MAG: 1,4-dihydroxy-2-naphthoyl-CoA synthase, partial [Chloroflexi bacterium]